MQAPLIQENPLTNLPGSENLNNINNIISDTPCLRLLKTSLPLSQQPTRENSQEIIEVSTESDDSLNDSTVDATSCPIEHDVNSCIFEKSNEEVRRSYISKLVDMKLLNLKPKKKCQNIFVFDWDDTLFCTSFFGNWPLTAIPPQYRHALHGLDITVSNLLLKALKHGDVFIITNSERGWVQNSARDALPKTYQVIMQKNVQVISARNEYEHVFPNDMYRWKHEAFLSLNRQFDRDVVTNVVALGDSELEIRAAGVLSQQFKKAILKTVKLKEHPKIDELMKQHKVIFRLFDEIFMSCRSMSVELGKNARS